MEQEAGDVRGRRRPRPASDADSLRVPPHSVEAEQSVLGGLLLDNSTWDTVADRLTAEDFYRRDHQLIFEAIAELSARSEPADAVTLAEYLAAKGQADETGGLAYLAGLAREHGDGERSTRRVMVLTLAMMVIEIIAGIAFGSMALLADGWHMGTHAVALGITALAYYFARRHADNPRFSFGTGKVGELGGFASAMVLAVIALIMAAESVQRLITPQTIRFNEAIAVAVVGLIVNVVSAYMLQDRHAHDHAA